MKKTFFASAAFLFLQPAFATEECRDISSYLIDKPVNFQKLELNDAVGRLVAGTGLVVKADTPTGIAVSGKDVSGPLDAVLQNLAENAHFSFRRDGCQIVITPVDASGNPIVPTWAVAKGDSLASVLDRWAKLAGWTLSYEIDGKIMLGGEVSYKGEFETSVDELISTIKKSSGVDVAHRFYYGNKTLRIYRSMLVEANKQRKEGQ